MKKLLCKLKGHRLDMRHLPGGMVFEFFCTRCPYKRQHYTPLGKRLADAFGTTK
jgi:hypothetical protein